MAATLTLHFIKFHFSINWTCHSDSWSLHVRIDQEIYDWTTADLISILFINCQWTLQTYEIITVMIDTSKVYRLPLFYNRWKENLVWLLIISNTLELVMTTVITNYHEFTNLIKNMKFTLKYAKCLVYRLFLTI